ncbi:hypothetical protein ACJJIG_04340 [Microbulbifer sp. SSSA007]|uniref:hypothetical protein n=1 Tax=Microbulbifer sp. SSSA007 TaxID=3243379 RepID=UPI00403A7C21
MEIFTLYLIPFFAMALPAAGLFISAKDLLSRISLESKLANRLARKISNENLDITLKLAAGEITVEAFCGTNDAYKNASLEMRDKIIEVLNEMSENEKETILKIINQPSKKGQTHYIKRVANKTLSSMETQAA